MAPILTFGLSVTASHEWPSIEKVASPASVLPPTITASYIWPTILCSLSPGIGIGAKRLNYRERTIFPSPRLVRVLAATLPNLKHDAGLRGHRAVVNRGSQNSCANRGLSVCTAGAAPAESTRPIVVRGTSAETETYGIGAGVPEKGRSIKRPSVKPDCGVLPARERGLENMDCGFTGDNPVGVDRV